MGGEVGQDQRRRAVLAGTTFQQKFNDSDFSTASSVMISICEVANVGGWVTPIQGAASLSVDDVVPGNGNSIVLGDIGWA